MAMEPQLGGVGKMLGTWFELFFYVFRLMREATCNCFPKEAVKNILYMRNYDCEIVTFHSSLKRHKDVQIPKFNGA